MRKSLHEYCTENDWEELLRQWHPTRNEALTPHTISYGSKKKPWWVCKNGHEWQAAVYTRTGENTGCPYCTGKKVRPGENDLASLNPELATQWHLQKNGSLLPTQVAAATHKKVWWLCDQGHEWQASVKSRQAGAGCPVCMRRSLVPGINDLATTHPSVADQWHPIKNGSLTPKNVLSGVHRKVWWVCDKKHEWQASVSARTSNGSGCPVCAGKVIISGENDMASLYQKVAQEWHPSKNDFLSPSMVSPYSNRTVWWVCEKGHEYAARVAARTMNGTGCPYCAGKKVLVGFNDLATLEPGVAEQWHPTLNGALTPQQVTAGANRKVWWQCPNGHVWKAVISSRARGKKHGCPVCAGRISEKKQERYRSMMT